MIQFLHAMDAADGGVDATELIMIVEDWQESVYEMECNIANGVEGSYSSQVLRYVYHNNEGLEGKIYLYNEQKSSLKRCLGERDEDLCYGVARGMSNNVSYTSSNSSS